jgi:uncharacterized membrane protein YuzA (DUF378 family)
MDTLKIINTIVLIVVMVGAINWGLVAGLNFDLVEAITPGNPDIEKIIKIVVGIAGLYGSYMVYNWKTKKEAAPAPVTAAVKVA